MQKTLPLLAALTAACLMTPAQAQTPGSYAGIGVMSVATDNASDFASAIYGASGSGDDSTNGLKIYGGYVFPNRFGIEAGYYDLGSYDVRGFGILQDEFKVSAFAVSGTYTLPMGASFDAIFKLGLAFTSADYTCVTGCGGAFVNTSESGAAGLLGAGVGWRVAPNFTLRADFEVFSGVPHAAGGQDVDYDYTAFSVSGQFNF